MMKKDTIRIGCGAGFSGDRIEPAVQLVEHGQLDFLVLECLAERTIALAQKRKKEDASRGYDPMLEQRIRALLPSLVRKNTRLISNMGAANPIAGAKKMIEIAEGMGFSLQVAVVLGDDVMEQLSGNEEVMESGQRISAYSSIISANAYLGADAILPALKTDAQIILTGRVADPSLFVAPMVQAFDWDLLNSDIIGQATMLGHLMECAGQITGGYFADPLMKPVEDLENLGYPILEVDAMGRGQISKLDGTGGTINVRTAKEQLLYEVVDPFAYITPDVTADFSMVNLSQSSSLSILATGGRGSLRPQQLKVSVGYDAGWIGEGEISYAGMHAKERAQWAGEIIECRIKSLYEDFKVDLIGLSSLHGPSLSLDSQPYEVRLRVAGRSQDPALARRIGEEVEALYTNGPAGGGGARKSVTHQVGVVSVLMDRSNIQTSIQLFST